MRWLTTPAGLVSFIMTRRMLIGIRDRAERHTRAIRRITESQVQGEHVGAARTV